MAKKKPRNPHLFWLLIACLALLTAAVKLWHATSAFDNWVMSAVFALRTPGGVAFFAFMTSFGNAVFVIAALCASVIILLLSRHQKGYAVGIAMAVVGAKATEVLIKVILERPRPVDVLPLFHLDTYSFPSGHAAGAMALYGFLTYLVCSIYPRLRVHAVLAGGALILLVGISRVYLGVHFPSDVLAGYLVGAIWICAGIGVVRYMRT